MVEAATILGTNRRRVLRLVQRGQLVPALKLPATTGAYLFDSARVQAFAEAQRGEQ